MKLPVQFQCFFTKHPSTNRHSLHLLLLEPHVDSLIKSLIFSIFDCLHCLLDSPLYQFTSIFQNLLLVLLDVRYSAPSYSILLCYESVGDFVVQQLQNLHFLLDRQDNSLPFALGFKFGTTC